MNIGKYESLSVVGVTIDHNEIEAERLLLYEYIAKSFQLLKTNHQRM